MYSRARYEICRFEHAQLLYRVYLFENGEIAFTVTGDAIRLGLHSQNDLRWNWFWDLPAIQETSRLVNLHSAPLKVMRTIALRLAQYLAKHQPAYFFYTLHDQPQRQRLYQQLLQRHPRVASLYDMQQDQASGYVMFCRRLPMPSESFA